MHEENFFYVILFLLSVRSRNYASKTIPESIIFLIFPTLGASPSQKGTLGALGFWTFLFSISFMSFNFKYCVWIFMFSFFNVNGFWGKSSGNLWGLPKQKTEAAAADQTILVQVLFFFFWFLCFFALCPFFESRWSSQRKQKADVCTRCF